MKVIGRITDSISSTFLILWLVVYVIIHKGFFPSTE